MKTLVLASVVICLAGYCLAQEGVVVDSEVNSEMKERAAFAEELFAPLSFNVGSYFYIQEDLKRYISELAVNDPQWNELKKLHSRKDYLGMIGVLKKEKLREYPSKEEIKSLYLRLTGEGLGCYFRLSVLLTHNIKVVCRAFPGKQSGVFLSTDFLSPSWTFKILGGKCFYIYSPDEKIDTIIKRYGDARDKVREDMKMARIYKDEGEAKIAALCDHQFNSTLKWLATAKVKTGDFINGRKPLPTHFWKDFSLEATKNVPDNAVKEGGATGDKGDAASDGIACPDCNGKKFITEKTCEKCEGTGYVMRGTWITDMKGNKMPAKKQKCASCKGKGKIAVARKKCETCGGTGRLAE